MTAPDRSKIGARNSRKGKRYERRVAQLISEWTGQVFRRRRVEGRDASVVMRESTSDVIPADGEIIFSVEAKSGAGFSLDSVMANPLTGLFSKWWAQANWDAQILTEITKLRRYPIVFLKPNVNTDWVAVSAIPFMNKTLQPRLQPANATVWFPHLMFDNYVYSGPITFDISQSKKHPVLKTFNLDPVVFCRWEDFAKFVDPSSIYIEQRLSN